MPDLAEFDGVPGIGRFPRLFLDLATGRAGRAMFGGPIDGRAGRGKAVAIFFYILLCRGECPVVQVVAIQGWVFDRLITTTGLRCDSNEGLVHQRLKSWSIGRVQVISNLTSMRRRWICVVVGVE